MQHSIQKPKIGIAVAVHNSAGVIGRCLKCLGNEPFTIVLFDDGSTDGTRNIARAVKSDFYVLVGDGEAWWSGGTARAVHECFALGCDYVLMLNPDAFIKGGDVLRLVDYAREHPGSIPAGLAVEEGNEDSVAWAGSRRVKLFGLPIYTSRYIGKRGSAVAELGNRPYETDEVHGRGVIVSRFVYDRIGTLDWKLFPHYGADNDYSLRARAAGIRMVILPDVKVRLSIHQSGMAIRTRPLSFARISEVWNFLTKRKNGEHFRVLWRLHQRHIPRYAVIPSFLFNLALVVIRRML